MKGLVSLFYTAIACIKMNTTKQNSRKVTYRSNFRKQLVGSLGSIKMNGVSSQVSNVIDGHWSIQVHQVAFWSIDLVVGW